MIESNIVKVPKWEAMGYLKPILDGYRSHGHEVYIGVTTAPELRCEQHAAQGWKRMVLVYEALNSDIAIELEQDLIDYASRCNFKIGIANVGAGGEGVRNGSGKHYLYFLLG